MSLLPDYRNGSLLNLIASISAACGATPRQAPLHQGLDALVVRRPHGLEPTPRAHALLPALQRWVEGAERLLQAREEAGVEQVFLFPAHDLARGYEMPEAEVQAFEGVIRPRLG